MGSTDATGLKKPTPWESIKALFATGNADDTPAVERIIEKKSNHPRLTDWLPFTAYHEAERLAVLEVRDRKNQERCEALGFTIELNAPCGISEEIVATLTTIVQAAPAGACMQLQMLASNDLEAWGERYLALRTNASFTDMARRRFAFYKNAAIKAPFASEPFLIRNFRLSLSGTAPCKDPRDQNTIDAMLRWRDQVVSVCRSVGLYQSVWNASDLIRYCDTILNAQRLFSTQEKDPLNYDASRLVRSQMIDPGTRVQPSDDGQTIYFSEPGRAPVAYRSFSVRTYPAEFDAYMANGLVGDFNQPNRGYSCPYLITVGWRKPDFDTGKNAAQMRAARATQQASTPLAKYMPELLEKKRDADVMQESFARGKGEVQMFHEIALFADANEIIRAEEAAKNVWRARGFSIANNTYMGMQGLLASLPMSLTPAMADDIKKADRFTTKTVDTVIATAPMIVDWYGVGEPIIPLIGRRGQIGGIDLFANEQGNYNGCIIGASGSGKSFFCQELILSYLAIGSKAWVIDIGRSYQKLCEAVGGQYIEFTSTAAISINPFPMVRDFDEDMELLGPLVCQMAQGASGTPLTGLQTSAIEKIIQSVWNEKAHSMTMTDLMLRFKEGKVDPKDDSAPYDKEIADLATRVAKYCEGGIYEKFFTGQPTLNFDNDFTVLELEELNSKQDLKAVVMMMTLYRITEDMFLQRSERRKIMLMDEAKGQLEGGSVFAAKFIDAGYLRARKYGGSFLTSTQGIEDYDVSPAAFAARQNADWMFMLRQKPESIAAMASSGKFVMDEALQRVMTGLKKINNEYAEVYVKSPMGSGLLRLIVDPYTSLLYSSNVADFVRIKALRQEGHSLDAAIETILAERGLESGLSYARQ
jgi:conjugal transfer ATP-binding protein TraC